HRLGNLRRRQCPERIGEVWLWLVRPVEGRRELTRQPTERVRSDRSSVEIYRIKSVRREVVRLAVWIEHTAAQYETLHRRPHSNRGERDGVIEVRRHGVFV